MCKWLALILQLFIQGFWFGSCYVVIVYIILMGLLAYLYLLIVNVSKNGWNILFNDDFVLYYRKLIILWKPSWHLHISAVFKEEKFPRAGYKIVVKSLPLNAFSIVHVIMLLCLLILKSENHKNKQNKRNSNWNSKNAKVLSISKINTIFKRNHSNVKCIWRHNSMHWIFFFCSF